LPAATNSFLTISNLAASRMGVYTVIITNSVGAVTSAPAWVTIIGPQLNLAGVQPGNGAFHLRFGGQPGVVYLIEASTDFKNWNVIGFATNINGEAEFYDYSATNASRRFYRSLWTP